MTNLDKDIRRAEALGYGVHYGLYKADHPNTKEAEPEVIDPDLVACRWCGRLFRMDRGRRKIFCNDECRIRYNAQREYEATERRRGNG